MYGRTTIFLQFFTKITIIKKDSIVKLILSFYLHTKTSKNLLSNARFLLNLTNTKVTTFECVRGP